MCNDADDPIFPPYSEDSLLKAGLDLVDLGVYGAEGTAWTTEELLDRAPVLFSESTGKANDVVLFLRKVAMEVRSEKRLSSGLTFNGGAEGI